MKDNNDEREKYFKFDLEPLKKFLEDENNKNLEIIMNGEIRKLEESIKNKILEYGEDMQMATRYENWRDFANKDLEEVMEIVHNLIVENVKLKEQKDLRLEKAASELCSEYETNEELTAFSSLDGEDIYDVEE